MSFEPKKIYGSDFNGGIKYSITDGFSPDDFNNIIEGLLYAQENGGSGGGVDQALVDQVNANTQEIGYLQSDSSRQEQEIINHTDKIHLLEEKDKAILANTDGVLDEAVFKGVTNNSINLSSEEKTSACEWLGATEKFAPAKAPKPGRVQVYASNGESSIWETIMSVPNVQKTPGVIPVYTSAQEGIIAKETTKGYLVSNNPVNDYHVATKHYVDDKIAELLARIEALESK